MNSILEFLRTPAIILSAWTALCLVVDLMTCIFSRNPTDITWYACNPLCLYKFPALNLRARTGLLLWAIAITILILTVKFYV